MPRPRLANLIREKTRHGAIVWYFRRYPGPRVRMRAEYGTPEFQAEYDAAATICTQPKKTPKALAGTVQWLYDRYRETTVWGNLAPGTRRQRENIFVAVMAKIGTQKCTAVNEASIEASKDARKDTPAQARNFLDAMRGLFRWAKKAQHVKIDPTANVENPKRPRGDGFPVWNDDDIARFESKWSEGTRQRVWLHVLLYTGLRRGDAVRLGKQHVRDGVATIKTEKSGMAVEINITILPPLVKTLAAGPCGDLVFICGARGEPLTKETFGNMFRDACRSAGVAKSAHGVRKIGATTAADNGATESELEAIFGWRGGAMASLYTRDANRKRLAKGAMHKMMRTPREQASPAPEGQKPRTVKNDK